MEAPGLSIRDRVLPGCPAREVFRRGALRFVNQHRNRYFERSDRNLRTDSLTCSRNAARADCSTIAESSMHKKYYLLMLDGILFLDRIANVKRALFKRKIC